MKSYSNRVTLAGISPEVMFGGGRVILALDDSLHQEVLFGGGRVTLAYPCNYTVAALLSLA